VKIFLSHASEQSELARSIEIALSGEGHAVFFDRSSLPSGDEYHERIRRAIADSDLLIFLISPNAVAKGRYTLNELEFAEQKWRHPRGHVLPVMVVPTEFRTIPVYLRAVTVLEPQGDVSAAVVAAVSRLSTSWWSRLGRARQLAIGAIAIVAAVGCAWFGMRYWKTHTEVSALLATGELHKNSGAYAEAWEVYQQAARLAPSRADVANAQQRAAMAWLENIRVTSGRETFTNIVAKVEPTLARCAVTEQSSQRANCLAHIGWGNFLRQRERTSERKPIDSYRAAIAADAHNPFAHAMWGFEILRTGGTLRDAKAHFEAGFASGRERQFVRHLQIAALLWRSDPDTEDELIRVVNDARLAHETLASDRTSGSDASRIWNVYYSRVVNRRDLESFLTAVSPADHLATFQWLFAEGNIPRDKPLLYRFLQGTFEERAGRSAAALESYRRVADQFERAGERAAAGTLYARVREAIQRLEKSTK
jgi:tetratricopeptide (TPR) repeat protein